MSLPGAPPGGLCSLTAPSRGVDPVDRRLEAAVREVRRALMARPTTATTSWGTAFSPTRYSAARCFGWGSPLRQFSKFHVERRARVAATVVATLLHSRLPRSHPGLLQFCCTSWTRTVIATAALSGDGVGSSSWRSL